MRCSNDSRRGLPDKIERYREQAAKYIGMSEATSDVGRKVKLIEMAETWLRLADQAEEIRLEGKHHLDV